MISEMINKNKLLFGTLDVMPTEASLMPDTYFYHFGDSKQSLILKMKNKMTEVLLSLTPQNKTTLKMEDIVILASIIEKETAMDQERFLISSVFHNRLQKQMKLQSDPTVIYAMSNGYGKISRPLKQTDYKFESKYNTYRQIGLPPTAICCPGAKSMIAAMNPATTDYLYFVVEPNKKTHVFTDNYKTHLKNIRAKRMLSNEE
jgi:UPF0755 protein